MINNFVQRELVMSTPEYGLECQNTVCYLKTCPQREKKDPVDIFVTLNAMGCH